MFSWGGLWGKTSFTEDFRSIIDYGSIAYGSASKTLVRKVEMIQSQVAYEYVVLLSGLLLFLPYK